MQAKTPIAQDKHLWVAVGTVLSLLIARFLGVQLEPELLASIVAVVATWITNSKVKEGKVAVAIAEAQKAGDAAGQAVEPKGIAALVNG